MEKKQIIAKIKEIIGEEREEKIELDENTLLKENVDGRVSLGMSSMELITIIIQIEAEYDIEIAESEIARINDVNSLVELILDNLAQGDGENLEKIKDELF